MRAIEYVRAKDVAGAVAMATADPGARYLAGGTTLLDLALKDRVVATTRLIDITRLPLREISLSGDTLRVGAMTTMEERTVGDISVPDVDAIIVAGGQAPMFTFEGARELQRKFVEFYESGKIAGALCHGSALLRHARLSKGQPLVAGRTVTGFANVEEDFADEAMWSMGLLPRDQHVMPWRIEDELRKLGANYVRSGRFRGFAIRDGNLVTGQQNFSGAETAELVAATLGV